MKCNREEESVGNFAMVAKFLNLNKLWSCKYGWKRNNKIGRYMFDVPLDCSQEQNSSPYFSFIVLPWQERMMTSRNFATMLMWHHISPLQAKQTLFTDTYIHTYIHTYNTPLFKPLIHRVVLKSYNISLRKEHNDTKERKKGRKSEIRKGKKKREKKHKEKRSD